MRQRLRMTGSGTYLFFFVFFLVLLSQGLAIPIFSLYFRSVGLSIVDTGAMFTIYGGSLLFFEVIWGFLADRTSRDLLPVIAVVGSVNYYLYPLVGHSFITLAALQAMNGFYYSGAAVVARQRVAEMVGHSRRGWAFGILGSTYGLSVVIGSFVDNAVAGRTSYSNNFYVAAIIAVISAIVLFRWMKRTQSEKPRLSPNTDRVPPSPVAGRFELVLLGFVAVAIFSSWGFFNFVVPVIVIMPAVGATTSQAILTVGIFNFSQFVFQPLMGGFGYKSPRTWIISGLLVNAIAFFLFTQTTNILAIGLLAFLAGASCAAVSPLSLSQLTTGVRTEYLGRALGFYGAAEDVGIMVGPFVASIVWQLEGLDYSFVTIGLFIVAVLITYAIAALSMKTRLRL